MNPAMCPGWVSGEVRLPEPGERVYTTEGPAEVKRMLGKTDSGGRLLELYLLAAPRSPFFASAGNILVAPVLLEDAVVLDETTTGG